MKLFSLIALSFVALASNAQQTTPPAPIKTKDSITVVVHKDQRVDQLVKKQAQVNEETTRDARRTAKGYRLLVINTNKREEAIAAKTKVYTYFPELKAYLIYQSPYFKVKVGNFKDRKEADEFRVQLNRHFPNGVFIVNDIIEIRPEDNASREPL